MSNHAANKGRVVFISVVFLSLLAGSAVLTPSAMGQILYVNWNSSAAVPDGLSWATAYADLQSAVNAAFDAGGGEVWVAHGTYTSTANPVLTLKAGVAVYGGFAGTESALEARDWETLGTVIDGQGLRRGVVGANEALLDGFTVTNGFSMQGGGMNNSASSPEVRNCHFTGNTASYYGGAMGNASNSHPVITNCRFTGNSASSYGGAMYNSLSSPVITDCSFAENSTPSHGAGMYNVSSASPEITNCTFSANTATQNGGAMYNIGTNTKPVITECSFTENTANNGGGMYNNGSFPELAGCSFTENTATRDGGGLVNYSGTPKLTNCNFTDNSAGFGGGILNINNASPEVIYCSFTGNTASLGGAMYGTGIGSKPVVTHCTFTANVADFGGGMYNVNQSSPDVTSCSFIENTTSDNGAGIFNDASSPLVLNCTFSENLAFSHGGGIYNANRSFPEVTNCRFIYNSAVNYGGALYNWDSDPVITNSHFAGNNVTFNGGAMFNDGASPLVMNCSFAENTAFCNGGGLFNILSSPVIVNSILWGNDFEEIYNYDSESVALVSYSCISGGYEGEGNIDQDPRFENAPLELQLSVGSPCIDTGTADGAPDTDLPGTPRPQRKGIDMGAYEFVGEDTTAPVITLNGPSAVTMECGGDYVDAGASAEDDWDGPVEVTVSGTVNTTVPGVYYISYSAVDSEGNETVPRVRTVTVVDTTQPVLELLGDNPLTLDGAITYDEPGATAFDSCGDVDFSAAVEISGDVNPLVEASYEVTYTVVDGAGNGSSATRLVMVKREACELLYDLTVGPNPAYSGETVTMRAVELPASCAVGDVHYQWERAIAGQGGAFLAIPGSDDTPQFILASADLNDTGDYRCTVTDSMISRQTPVVTLTVNMGVSATGGLGLALAAVVTLVAGAGALRKRRD